jgi:hypothetical protein
MIIKLLKKLSKSRRKTKKERKYRLYVNCYQLSKLLDLYLFQHLEISIKFWSLWRTLSRCTAQRVLCWSVNVCTICLHTDMFRMIWNLCLTWLESGHRARPYSHGGYSGQCPKNIDPRGQSTDGSKAEAWDRDRPLFMSTPADPMTQVSYCLSGLTIIVPYHGGGRRK